MQRAVLLLLLALLATTASAADYYFSARKATQGGDLDCGQRDKDGKRVSTCRRCGITEIFEACEANSACKGFDVDFNDISQCGYLKTKAGPSALKYQGGNMANYCKAGAGSACEGDYLAVFNKDIKGRDLDCGRVEEGVKKEFCREKGNPINVADSCTSKAFGKECAAFTTNSAKKNEGFLKVAKEPLESSDDFVVYIRLDD